MRTFIAIEVPEPLLKKLVQALEPLRAELDEHLVRWTRPTSMHLTLKFLGEIDVQQAQTIQTIMDKLARSSSKFELHLSELGFFPNTKRPRVVWVGFDPIAENLLALQVNLEQRLEDIGIEREHREYHPHLTVGRLRKGISKSDQDVVSAWAQSAELGSIGAFTVEAITLIQSVLKPSGAEYTNLHSAELST